MKASKIPALQLYIGDWRKDPGIQALNYEERGVWMEMLFLMHESECRGKLMLGGKPYPIDRLAYVLRLSPSYLEVIITTLLDTGVASRCEETGALVNRRMLRDAELSKKRKNAGKGGGNPNFQKGKPNPYYVNQDERLDNQKDKQKITPSSSSSSSSSFSTHTPREGDDLPGNEEPTPITASMVPRKSQAHFAEIPSEREWMDACAMGGVPPAFAAEVWRRYVGKVEWWTCRPWRHNVPMVKGWLDKDVNELGTRNHDGTEKPKTNGYANSNPGRQPNVTDWSKQDF